MSMRIEECNSNSPKPAGERKRREQVVCALLNAKTTNAKASGVVLMATRTTAATASALTKTTTLPRGATEKAKETCLTVTSSVSAAAAAATAATATTAPSQTATGLCDTKTKSFSTINMHAIRERPSLGSSKWHASTTSSSPPSSPSLSPTACCPGCSVSSTTTRNGLADTGGMMKDPMIMGLIHDVCATFMRMPKRSSNGSPCEQKQQLQQQQLTSDERQEVSTPIQVQTPLTQKIRRKRTRSALNGSLETSNNASSGNENMHENGNANSNLETPLMITCEENDNKRRKLDQLPQQQAGEPREQQQQQQECSRSPISISPQRRELSKKRKRRVVYIWDLDETLILMVSLYNGSFARATGKDVLQGELLGKRMMNFLLKTLEEHFFFNDLHDSDLPHISCMSESERLQAHVQMLEAKHRHHHSHHHHHHHRHHRHKQENQPQDEGAASSSSSCEATSAPTPTSPAKELSKIIPGGLSLLSNGHRGRFVTPVQLGTLKQQYSRIRSIYEQKDPGVTQQIPFLNQSDVMYELKRQLVDSIEEYSNGWIAHATRVLQAVESLEFDVSTRSQKAATAASPAMTSLQADPVTQCQKAGVNVLVTNTQLVPALCKCLLYGLNHFFDVENIYSSSKIQKRCCFASIMAKFAGEECDFVAIGDGMEEERVSKELGIRFVKINCLRDLMQLGQLIRHGEI